MIKTSVPHLLAGLPEARFLEQVSQGIALIVRSLGSLERAGEALHKLGMSREAKCFEGLPRRRQPKR